MRVVKILLLPMAIALSNPAQADGFADAIVSCKQGDITTAHALAEQGDMELLLQAVIHVLDQAAIGVGDTVADQTLLSYFGQQLGLLRSGAFEPFGVKSTDGPILYWMNEHGTNHCLLSRNQAAENLLPDPDILALAGDDKQSGGSGQIILVRGPAQ